MNTIAKGAGTRKIISQGQEAQLPNIIDTLIANHEGSSLLRR